MPACLSARIGAASIPRDMFDGARYERIASALRALAADLAAERRRSSALRRENEQLKTQLEAAKEQLASRAAHTPCSSGIAVVG
jgi:cell shape-determining protein MreC